MPIDSVRLEQVSPVPLAVIQRTVRMEDLSRVVPEGCGIVWNALKAQGLRGGHNVAVYWDDSIRLEVGVEMGQPFREENGVVRSSTPGGRVATVTHYGPYAGLKAAHEAVQDWCKTRELGMVRPCWEVYGHWQEEWNRNPSLIRTDVFYKVAGDG